MPWVSDSEFEKLQNIAYAGATEERLTADENEVDKVLRGLRETEDPSYERARKRALEDALAKGDDKEFIRISEQHKSFISTERT